VPNVALDPHWSTFARNHPDLNIHSIACVPIRSGENTVGVIQLLNSKLDLLSEYSISFLRILCDYAAIAIQNARSVKLIQQLSITDDCTQLFNARHLYAMLDEREKLTHHGKKVPFSLLFMDLDHFKSVNDHHGHLIGSKLLGEVGNLLKRIAGPESSAFRYGGDEFVVLLPLADKAAAAKVAREMCERMRDHAFLTGDGLALRLTGSFGLATFPEDGDTVHAILRASDSMMYEVKNSTRNDIAIAGETRAMNALKPSQSERRVIGRR